MKQQTAGVGPPCDPQTQQFVIEAFDAHERKLTAYALRFFGGRNGDLHSARDAVQFTFLKLCQQEPHSLEGKLLPWLYTVCRNRILDEMSKNGRRQPLNDLDAVALDSKEPDPAKQFELDDLLRRIPQLFGCLADNEREAIELWSHGLKASEIAEVIGKAPGTVRVAIHRAIKKLRQHPEIQNWLERATGQRAEPKFCSNSNASSLTGEKA